MNKITEYQLLVDTYASGLTYKVQDYLNMGWQVYMQPYYANGNHIQAVVKYE